MDIKFPCAECGANLKVRATLVGSSIRCPRCAKKTVVPQVAGAALESAGGDTDGAPATAPSASSAGTVDRQALEQEIAKRYQSEIDQCRRTIADLRARLAAEMQGSLPESARLDLPGGDDDARADVALYTVLSRIRKSAFGRRLRLVILFHAFVIVLIVIGGTVSEAKARAAKAAAAVALTNGVPIITNTVARPTGSNLIEQAAVPPPPAKAEAPAPAGAETLAAKPEKAVEAGPEKAKPEPAAEKEATPAKTEVPQATEVKLD